MYNRHIVAEGKGGVGMARSQENKLTGKQTKWQKSGFGKIC
jgi:hypothetical protein